MAREQLSVSNIKNRNSYILVTSRDQPQKAQENFNKCQLHR